MIGNKVIKDQFTIYVKVKIGATMSDICSIVTEYGIVTHFSKMSCKEEAGFSWWHVRYSRPSEAHFADEALTAVGIIVQRNKPIENATYITTEFQNYVANDDVTDTSEHYGDTLHYGEHYGEDNHNCSNCHQFCHHFHKHPKTVCCRCPYLYMWLIFIISCILFPLLFCIFVEKLELGIIEV